MAAGEKPFDATEIKARDPAATHRAGPSFTHRPPAASMPTPGPGSIQNRFRIYWPRREQRVHDPDHRAEETHPPAWSLWTCQGSELKSGGGVGASSAALQSRQVPLNPAPEFAHNGRVISPALSQSPAVRKLPSCASSNDVFASSEDTCTFTAPIPSSGRLPAMAPRLAEQTQKSARRATRGTLRAPPCAPLPPFEVRAQFPPSSPGPDFGVTTRCTMIGLPAIYRPIRG